MIQISSLEKSYASQTLFSDASFSINPGDKIGLIGRNGEGKSTLIKIFSGEEEADSGKIHYPNDYSVGHLSQHLNFKEKTVIDEAALELPLMEGGWKETYKVEAILTGLGFTQEMLTISPLKLSGGYQVRLNLAKLLSTEPNLLLLDEPTNYLDIVSLLWLVSFLKKWPGELILITHDHHLMNQICKQTLGIHRKKVRKITGSTEKYYQQIALEEEVQEQSRLNKQKKIEQTEKFIDTFRAKASKAKAVQSRVKALEKMSVEEKLEDQQNLEFKFNHKPHPGKELLSVKNLEFGYDDGELLIQNLSFNLGKNDRLGIIGKNGKGKSTLLNVLAKELKPISGEVTHSNNLELSYFGQTNITRLDTNKTIEEELASVSDDIGRTHARSIAGQMMFSGDMALKKISVLSGGEKSRVLLGRILLQQSNLLILDEPTNHLDMQSTQALYKAIRDFPGAVIFVSHSEYMLNKIASKLVVFDRGKTTFFNDDYKYFLKTVGWSDFEEEGASTSSSSSGLSKKEIRQKKAEIKTRMQEVCGDLKKKVQKLEKEIMSLEEQQKEISSNLIEITKDGFGEKAKELSRNHGEVKAKVEKLFDELTELSLKLESKESEFKVELDSLN